MNKTDWLWSTALLACGGLWLLARRRRRRGYRQGSHALRELNGAARSYIEAARWVRSLSFQQLVAAKLATTRPAELKGQPFPSLLRGLPLPENGARTGRRTR